MDPQAAPRRLSKTVQSLARGQRFLVVGRPGQAPSVALVPAPYDSNQKLKARNRQLLCNFGQFKISADDRVPVFPFENDYPGQAPACNGRKYIAAEAAAHGCDLRSRFDRCGWR